MPVIGLGAEAAPQDAWPLFRGDPQATGVAPGPLAEKLDVLWTSRLPHGDFEAAVAIADGTVVAGSMDGEVLALDLATGKQKWQRQSKSGYCASPVIRDGRVYVGDMDGGFQCLGLADGKPIWRFDTDAEINSSANFHGPHVLFGSQDSTLYCLEAKTGQLV